MGADMTARAGNGASMSKRCLDNGLRILLKESHLAPVASFWIFYRVGSRNETAGVTGISHWVEHMLFKGTDRYPQGAFDKAVARAGGSFNGMTWQDWTTYFETFPAERIELALDIESDRMANAIFDRGRDRIGAHGHHQRTGRQRKQLPLASEYGDAGGRLSDAPLPPSGDRLEA